jgi:hypothetical protein
MNIKTAWRMGAFSVPPVRNNIIVAGLNTPTNPFAVSYNNGVNWTAVASNIFQGVNDICTNGSVWLAVGVPNTHSAAYSTDGGLTWIGITLPGRALVQGTSCCWNGSKFVISGYSDGYVGELRQSSDGVSGWSAIAVSDSVLKSFSGFDKLFYGNGKYVGCGFSESYNIAYSTDGGLTWTGVAKAYPPANGRSYCGCYTGSRYLVAGYKLEYGDEDFMYSADGISYVFGLNNIPLEYPNRMRWNGSRALVCSLLGLGAYTLAYCDNPHAANPTWTGIKPSALGSSGANAGALSLCWNGSVWVAGGNSKLAYSVDAINWTASVYTPNGPVTALACKPAPNMYPAII